MSCKSALPTYNHDISQLFTEEKIANGEVNLTKIQIAVVVVVVVVKKSNQSLDLLLPNSLNRV